MIRDLTEGKERNVLIRFSIPLILGNLIQQMYNIADTLIVGKFLGANALAAVGASYTLMVLITSIILGLCIGSGIVFSQLFGAKRIDDLKTSIFNSFIFISFITIIVNIGVFIILDKLLVWLNIPMEAITYTKAYLKIIFMGIGFTFIYNFISSILRSVGNSIVPLIFLAISAIINIILDIIFILLFNMGVRGAAFATIIAQGFSAISVIIYFCCKSSELKPNRRNMYYDKVILKRLMSNSILTCIQQSIMNFGILMVQSLVNSFGISVMAAFATVTKIDSFAYMPAQDFGNAYSTYIAQNYGAKKFNRINKGTKEAIKISLIFCIITSIIVFIFAKYLMMIFVSSTEKEVIATGIQYLRIEGICYVGIGLLFLFYGFYRGIGKVEISIILTIVSLGSRVLLAYTLSSIESIGVLGIWLAIPIGWLLADSIGFIYFKIKKDKLFIKEDNIINDVMDIL